MRQPIMLEKSFGFKALGPAFDFVSVVSVMNTDRSPPVFTLC